MLLQSGSYEAALAEFAHARGTDPSNPVPQAYWAHSKRLVSGVKPDPDGDLADTLRMVTMMAPEMPEGHLFLGLLYEHADRPQRARSCLQEVLRLRPGNAEAKAALQRLSRLVHEPE